MLALALKAQNAETPDLVFGNLFTEVQMERIFPDNKTFVDAVPKYPPHQILASYLASKDEADFSLSDFVTAHFSVIGPLESHYITDNRQTVVQHINRLWTVLERMPEQPIEGSSILPLPYPYIVPGGRFNEIYYWDSYFTMLGLQVSGELGMVENMVKNFAYMIDKFGHIPNGNRSYFLSRSQPPYFSLMLELLSEDKGSEVFAIYKEQLLREYNYWMDKTSKTNHVVRIADSVKFNRYYDQYAIPRQESYFEDSTMARELSNPPALYRDLRSGAESGWDFSSRWLADGQNLNTIETTKILPVDLNCLLYHLEMTISKAYKQTGDSVGENKFRLIAKNRKAAINYYFYNKKDGWYYDYNIRTKKLSTERTIAGMTPFFLDIAPEKAIKKAAAIVKSDFLRSGGLVTTLKVSGEQWDAPNGWAPLQWIAIKGLRNYGEHALAENIAKRWIALNTKVFQSTGKMMEKYNVMDASLEAGGGEYPAQDGFGWSNGVLLKLIRIYGEY